uniref:Uncharacterized protein n=1 Tax=Meloidogyne floridensis TaxID=298350 RepID=A0A915PH59_9BILA
MCSIGNKIIIASVLLVIICEFDIVSSVRNRHPGPQAENSLDNLTFSFGNLNERVQTAQPQDYQNLMGEAQNLYNRYLTVRQAVVMHNNVEARNTLTHELQTLRTQFVNTIGQGGNINEFQAQLTQAQNLYQQYGSAQGVPPAAVKILTYNL